MAGSPWLWLAGAALLGALEAVLPGYILLGFGIGAAAVGVLLLVGGPLGTLMAGSLPGTLLVFAVISLGGWLALRRWAGGRARDAKRIDYDINDNPPEA